MLPLHSITFDISVRSPGGTQESYFQTAKNAGAAPLRNGVVDELSFDHLTGLIRIRKGTVSRWVPVTRARDMEIDESPAAPVVPPVKVAPAKPQVDGRQA